MKSFVEIVAKLESPLSSSDPDVTFWNPEYWNKHAEGREYWLTQKYFNTINKNVNTLLDVFHGRNATTDSYDNAYKDLLAMQQQIEEESEDALLEEKKYIFAIVWVYCKALRKVMQIEASPITGLKHDSIISACNLLFNLKLCCKSVQDAGQVNQLFDYFVKVLFKRVLPDPYVTTIKHHAVVPVPDARSADDSMASFYGDIEKNGHEHKKARQISPRAQLESKKLVLTADDLGLFFKHEMRTRNYAPKFNNRWNCKFPPDSSYLDMQLKILATFVYYCRDYKYLLEIMQSFKKILGNNIASLSNEQLKSYHLLIAGKFSGEARERFTFDQLIHRGDMSIEQATSIVEEQDKHIAAVQAEEQKCLAIFAQEFTRRGIEMVPNNWVLTPETSAIEENVKTSIRLIM